MNWITDSNPTSDPGIKSHENGYRIPDSFVETVTGRSLSTFFEGDYRGVKRANSLAASRLLYQKSVTKTSMLKAHTKI